jgi:glycine/D-amino acid oxidase-like deaminating enzyme
MAAPDFAIVGGGIVGCAAAAFLAEAGASVVLFEREAIGAAASGRNSGAVQHPFDPELTALHWETVETYRGLEGFAMPAEPAGLLVLAHDEPDAAEAAAALREAVPELEAQLIAGGELAKLEPALADGLSACRLETAYAIPPAAATNALAERARRAGARIETGVEAAPWVEAERVLGTQVLDHRGANGEPADRAAATRRIPAGAVLVAAGPWTIPLLPTGAGTRAAIAPTWGVNVQVELARPPRHVVEQIGVEIADPAQSAARAAEGEVPSLFSLVSAAGESTLGSTFLDYEPDGATLAPTLRERGTEYVPALRTARIVATRVCARPQSADGRPLLGPVPGVDGLFVCAGHGPWGISIGPASARLVADSMLGRSEPIPAALRAGRLLR